MYRGTKIMDRKEDSHKYMTDLMFQETSLTAEIVHFTKAKKCQFLEVMKAEEGCTKMEAILRG